MRHNRAYRIHQYGGPEVLQLDDVPVPSPAPGQVLVKVTAAGVNGADWKLRQGLIRGHFPTAFPAALGLELSGVVVTLGVGAGRFQVDDRVMGPIGLGAYTEYAAVGEAALCLVPDELTAVQAAAIPVAALTAWQTLRAAGELRPAQRVLIHGAAGGVGGFAVQFAKAAGATVLATAATRNMAYVLSLGADEVIDYQTERFEDRAVNIDLVLDLVGGETLDRPWQVLAPGGAVVSITAPDIAARAPAGKRGLWL